MKFFLVVSLALFSLVSSAQEDTNNDSNWMSCMEYKIVEPGVPVTGTCIAINLHHVVSLAYNNDQYPNEPKGTFIRIETVNGSVIYCKEKLPGDKCNE